MLSQTYISNFYSFLSTVKRGEKPNCGAMIRMEEMWSIIDIVKDMRFLATLLQFLMKLKVDNTFQNIYIFHNN